MSQAAVEVRPRILKTVEGDSPIWPGKYLSITSFRRDGTGVATPVWFVQEGSRLLVQTDSQSGKVKRIRHNPLVKVAPCAASGRLRGELVNGRAELLHEREVGRVEELMARKYRLDRVLILPIYRFVQALRHRGRPHPQPVVIEITPV